MFCTALPNTIVPCCVKDGKTTIVAVHRHQESICDGLSVSGIENVHWHDLSYTFGTRLAEAGVSEATIADLMGHSDSQTTWRYTHANDRAKRAAVEAVRGQAIGSATILPQNKNGHL